MKLYILACRHGGDYIDSAILDVCKTREAVRDWLMKRTKEDTDYKASDESWINLTELTASSVSSEPIEDMPYTTFGVMEIEAEGFVADKIYLVTSWDSGIITPVYATPDKEDCEKHWQEIAENSDFFANVATEIDDDHHIAENLLAARRVKVEEYKISL